MVAEGGVTLTSARREARSALRRDAERRAEGKSREARVVVRRKVKLTGGAHLSVAVGGEWVREWVVGPCGISWAGARSRPAVGGASARGVGPRHARRRAAHGFDRVGVGLGDLARGSRVRSGIRRGSRGRAGLAPYVGSRCVKAARSLGGEGTREVTPSPGNWGREESATH